jgi:hypothetical protein
VKGEARTLNAMAGAGFLAGAVGLGTALAGGAPQDLIPPAFIAVSSVAAFGANILRLPRWADTRRRQMDYIAARIAAIMDGGAPATE